MVVFIILEIFLMFLWIKLRKFLGVMLEIKRYDWNKYIMLDFCVIKIIIWYIY